ncbi:DNA cytosine methyltransferase [Pectobacterium colocasium]|uniref:DNA cytosine methyltransferase n=1 Tax=Pectobacterium colocasium TaxID=2878098 RepID=UPI003305E26F
MPAYYNEIDPYAAQWLRNLIAAGHIAPGDVDERSIEDVTPDDLRNYTQCHFFAGIGVWSYALRRAGWPDERHVWTASHPCQPFSQIGLGRGFSDERHLYPHVSRLAKERKPTVIFGEQVASKGADYWIDLVQVDVESMGYAFGCIPFPAAGVGAPNERERAYWVAYAENLQERSHERKPKESTKEQGKTGRCHISVVEQYGKASSFWSDCEWLRGANGRLLPIESGTLPLVDGDSKRVGRISAYGNSLNAEAAKEFIAAFLDVLRGQ